MNNTASNSGDFANCYLFPPSFGQERLWFLAQLDPAADVAYHLYGAVHLSGRLDTVLLQRAFNNVASNQESLRTGLAVVGGSLRQIVLPMVSIMIPTIDCSELCGSGGKSEIDDLMVREICRPFKLDNPPLIRLILYRTAANEHVLLMVLHHVIADGWSLNILWSDIASEYSLLATGGTSRSSDPGVQYGDYSVWQREHVTRDSMASQMEYWRRHLAGVPPLEMPTDLPRPASRSGRGGVCRMQLDDELLVTLIGLGRRHQSTLFMVLLTGFNVLLGRYGGQLDFAVGTAVANRRSAEIENLVGLFANTLAIRTDLTGDPTFVEMLNRTREACLGAYEHQDVPFEWIVEDLRPARDLSRSPLFQVMLVLHEALGDLGIAGLNISSAEELDSGTAKFDLFLSAMRKKEGLSLALEFNADIFDVNTATLLLAYYEQTLREFTRSPGQKIADIRLNSPRAFISPIKGRVREPSELFSEGRAVHEIIAAQAMSTPEALALSDESTLLSYRQLLDRVSDMARCLRTCGVRAGDAVAVCLGRSADVPACLLAIAASGAAYLPIDPDLPSARSFYMMKDTRARVVITSATVRAKLALAGRHVIIVGDGFTLEHVPPWPATATTNQRSEDLASSLDDLAYLIYTSGSTGKPKGVQVNHRTLASQLIAMRTALNFAATDVLIAVTSVSFDIAALELFLPLMCGGHVVISSVEAAADGNRLCDLIRDRGATMVQATPATWRLLLAVGWQPSPGFRILCGGEVLDAELAERLLRTGAQVWNLYGPTEATIWASVGVVDDPLRVRLGRPLTGTTMYLLNDRLRPVPLGAVGELYLGGRCVAVGYHRAAALTAQRFMPDPFAESSGARMYRTGDWCRLTSEGELQFIGRGDDQVKIRGFRVNLSEIEAVLAGESGVHQCAVVVRHHSATDVRLAAFVVPSRSAQSNSDRDQAADLTFAEQLRVRAASELPLYAVPATFSVLSSMPLTPSGKVDRRALETMVIEAANQGAVTGPETKTEHVVAQAFAAVLGVRSVGLFSNFFEIGGHSLLAPKLIWAIKKETGLDVPIRVLFETPTVKEFAARVDTIQASSHIRYGAVQMRRQVSGFSDALVDDLLRELTSGRSPKHHED
jgi:amino acid adenylation domain-containing protein